MRIGGRRKAFDHTLQPNYERRLPIQFGQTGYGFKLDSTGSRNTPENTLIIRQQAMGLVANDNTKLGRIACLARLMLKLEQGG
jgi:hypothetical protein